jgi:hypothetical protein
MTQMNAAKVIHLICCENQNRFLNRRIAIRGQLLFNWSITSIGTVDLELGIAVVRSELVTSKSMVHVLNNRNGLLVLTTFNSSLSSTLYNCK